jgi:hypothetical protein
MKKKGKKKKAGQVLTPETVEKVERLLEDLKTQEAEGKRLEASLQSVQSQMGMSIDQDVALIDAIGGVPSERMARLLQSLLDRQPDKKIVKAIKRSLYRMEQKGVPVEPAEGEDQTDSILRPPVQEESRGSISFKESSMIRVGWLISIGWKRRNGVSASSTNPSPTQDSFRLSRSNPDTADSAWMRLPCSMKTMVNPHLQPTRVPRRTFRKSNNKKLRPSVLT